MEFGGAVRSGLEIVSIQGMADASALSLRTGGF